MKATSFLWNDAPLVPESDVAKAQVVIYFGPVGRLKRNGFHEQLRQAFPAALLFGCSSGGQIGKLGYDEDAVAGIALSFASSCCRIAKISVADRKSSFETGASIARELADDDLAGILLLSDGLDVNGSELAAGIGSLIHASVPIAGGMAGDNAEFRETLVGANGPPERGIVAALGFYGNALELRTGNGGGWTEFGPRRTITGSSRNVLHELDGAPALRLYEKYLGEEARDLPGSGLRFPLLVRNPQSKEHALIRTLLGVDRSTGSMTFAGNMPEGWTAQLMRASFARLVDGARTAVNVLADGSGGNSQAALLVSCIGRRLMLGQRTDDEIEAVREGLGENVAMAGFYSFGEFSPQSHGEAVELHNQTMTVISIAERVL